MTQRFYLRNTTNYSSNITSGEKSLLQPVAASSFGTSPVTRDLSSTAGTTATSDAFTTNQAAAQNGCLGRWISTGLSPGTYGAGTWTVAFTTQQSNAAVNAFAVEGVVYFWRPSTNTIVGYVCDSDTADGIEFSNNGTGVYGQVITWTGSAVTIQSQDVLVFEFWVKYTQGATNKSYTITNYYNGTTVPTNGSTSTNAAAYIEAPADIPESVIYSSSPWAFGGSLSKMGDYWVHTFTSDGTFVLGSASSLNIEYLIIAGGGGGGSGIDRTGGGGGAGGVLIGTTTLTADATITVGSGGTGGSVSARSTNGQNSSLNSITAIGGGGGGGAITDTSTRTDSLSGGSGGGNRHGQAGTTGAAGTTGQGNSGGGGYDSTNATLNFGSGGGGGATSAGGRASQSSTVVGNAGNGGAGIEWPIGTGTYYAGGGGGGAQQNNATLYAAGTGGLGGGGNGAYAFTNTPGRAGYPGNQSAGSGGGGGASNSSGDLTSVGGNGGSGIVIIRYLAPGSTELVPSWGIPLTGF